MFPSEILILGAALAMDAAVVSFAYGLLCKKSTRMEKWQKGLITAFLFGFFQFLMLWLGSYAGYLISFSSIGHIFQFLVGSCFFLLAIKCVQESFSEGDTEFKWAFVPLLILATATSADALAAGVSLGTMPEAHFIALEVGIITAVFCSVFFTASQFLKSIPENWLLRLAASIFAFLGGQVMWQFIF